MCVLVHGVVDALQAGFLRMKNVRDRKEGKGGEVEKVLCCVPIYQGECIQCLWAVIRFITTVLLLFFFVFQENINGDASVGNVVVRIGLGECTGDPFDDAQSAGKKG